MFKLSKINFSIYVGLFVLFMIVLLYNAFLSSVFSFILISLLPLVSALGRGLGVGRGRGVVCCSGGGGGLPRARGGKGSPCKTQTKGETQSETHDRGCSLSNCCPFFKMILETVHRLKVTDTHFLSPSSPLHSFCQDLLPIEVSGATGPRADEVNGTYMYNEEILNGKTVYSISGNHKLLELIKSANRLHSGIIKL